jgi:hypothetical protein
METTAAPAGIERLTSSVFTRFTLTNVRWTD